MKRGFLYIKGARSLGNIVRLRTHQQIITQKKKKQKQGALTKA